MANAQTATNSIRGIVFDPDTTVIPNANVSVTKVNPTNDTKQLSTSEVKTDYVGNFTFKDLSPGEYTLTVSALGFSDKAIKQVLVLQGKTVEVEIEIGTACNQISDNNNIVNDTDRAEIAKITFENITIVSPGLSEAAQRTSLIISTQHIKAEWFNGVSDKNVKLMNQDQIQLQASSTDIFHYIEFMPFVVKSGCVAVDVAVIRASGRNSRLTVLSGIGKRFEFRKVSGKWFGRFTSGWTSQYPPRPIKKLIPF